MAARLARREILRHPGRSTLVACLVALPVAGMVLAAAVFRTAEMSAEEHWRVQFGHADAVTYQGALMPPSPEGTRMVRHTRARGIVATAGGGLCDCVLADLPFEPLTEGIVQVASGRPPARSDEVLLSAEAADALGSGLGDRIELVEPLGLEAEVVGIGYESAAPEEGLVVLPPDLSILGGLEGETRLLVDLPDGMTDAERAAWLPFAGPHLDPTFEASQLATVGMTADADKGVGATWAAGALSLTVLGIIIAAAFAASARRQLVMLGLLAANGAPPPLLRRVLFLQGTLSGLVGSVLGLGLGAVGLVALRPRAQEIVGHVVFGWEVRVPDVLPVVAIATLAATLAAMVPAVGVGRIPVLAALAGRRPLGKVSRRWTAAGVGLSAVGLGMLAVAASAGGARGSGSTAVAALAAAAPVAVLLGVCLAAPAYTAVLRPVAVRLRGPWRLAARSLLRQRTRTSALVAAICAVSAVAITVAAVGLVDARNERAEGRLDDLPRDVVRIPVGDAPGAERSLDRVLRQVERIVPGAVPLRVSELAEPGLRGRLVLAEDEPDVAGDDAVIGGAEPDVAGDAVVIGGSRDELPGARVLVVDDQFRRAYDLGPAAEAALDEVGAVGFLGTGRATVRVDGVEPTLDDGSPGPVVPVTPRRFDVEMLRPEDGEGLNLRFDLLITPARATELGFVTDLAHSVLRAPAPLSGPQLAELERLQLVLRAGDRSSTDPIGSLEAQPPADPGQGAFIEALPAFGALLFVLLVVAAGLALAAAETRDERDVLAVLGAAPRMVRRTSGCKAFLLTLLGAALAVPVGLLPVAVFTRSDTAAVSFLVPWHALAVVVVVMPVVAAVLTTAASRLALRARPVVVSTLTFE